MVISHSPSIAEPCKEPLSESPAGEYTALSHKDHFRVMSDLDGELIEHVPFIEKAHGRVLITGLGLALLPLALLDYGQVQSIDIVEIDQDVIDLVWPHVQDHRITLHHADAYTWDAAGRSWDFAWHDITYFYRDAKEAIAALRARFDCPAQDVWGERLLCP